VQRSLGAGTPPFPIRCREQPAPLAGRVTISACSLNDEIERAARAVRKTLHEPFLNCARPGEMSVIGRNRPSARHTFANSASAHPSAMPNE
jgi:hypothetical protein